MFERLCFATLKYFSELSNRKIKEKRETLYAISIALEIIWLIFVFVVFGIKSKLFPSLFFVGSICVIILSIFISWKFFGVEFGYGSKIKENIGNIEKEIENRDPKYIKWVKEWMQDEKEEKEFKKSLLK